MEPFGTVFQIVVIIFSIIVHEVMHGVAADRLGDPTARYSGRLTLNPSPHIDFMGSILVPIITSLAPGSFVFGWAKPVPYNPYNLRPGRFSEAIVALAGPAANLGIVILMTVILRLFPFDVIVVGLIFTVIYINLILAFLNLIPIPPLDGSKVVSAILPRALSRGYDNWRTRMEYNPFLGMGLVLVVIVVLGQSFGAFVFQVARLIAGV